jgi:hypothetical protein
MAQTAPPLCPPAPAVIGFAPPLGQPLRLEVRSDRPLRDGRAQQFHLIYRLTFTAAPRGFRLRATLLRAGADEARAVADTVRDLLAPLVGKEADYRLSADGQALVLQNGAELWAAVEADLLAISARAPATEGRQVGAIIRALPYAEREALLMADIRAMLRFAGRRWAEDFAVQPDWDNQDCQLLLMEERVGDSAAADPTLDRRQWQVDARTGLVRSFSEQRWLQMGGGGEPRLVAQGRWTLRPE